MYCAKCGTKLNEQGVCMKCSGVQRTGKRSLVKMLLLISSLGLIVSILLGRLVWNLTETEVYHEFSKTGDMVRDFGIYGYHTTEHNQDATICAFLIGILITVGIDIYIFVKNRK